MDMFQYFLFTFRPNPHSDLTINCTNEDLPASATEETLRKHRHWIIKSFTDIQYHNHYKAIIRKQRPSKTISRTVQFQCTAEELPRKEACVSFRLVQLVSHL